MLTMKKEKMTTRTLVKIGVLGAIAFILQIFEFPLWFTPGFLKFDLSEMPALLGSFAIGPMAGVMITLIKNIVKVAIRGSNTMVVGDLSNFVVGSIFAYVAGVVYHRNKTFKNAILGLTLGTIAMTVGASLSNYYIMIPFYAKVFGMPIDKIVAMSGAVNKAVVDYKTLILYAVVPFNLFKGAVTTFVTLLLYKRVSPILHK